MPADASQKFGGDWTEKKLVALRKYLYAYVTALKKQRFSLAYIDAFAGTGYREPPQREDEPVEGGLFPEYQAEAGEFLDGSVRISLGVEPPFAKYVLIERNKRKFQELARLKEDFPERAQAIELMHGDCNSELRTICREWDWRAWRAVLFLDPFGMQVEWETMQAVAATQAIDVWVLFPLGQAVMRLLKKDGNIPEEWQRPLNRIFGTNEWRTALYESQPSPNLFDSGAIAENRRGAKAVADFYNSRLASIFAGVAPNPLTLANSNGTPLFLLCFAAANPNGAAIAVRIAQHILKEKDGPKQRN